MGRVALSLEAILHLDQLRVKYHGGYPANRLKINDRLYAMHGHASKGSKGSTTNHYLHNSDMPTISKLSGHTHRNESSSRRIRLGEDEWRVVSADSFGTLCKVDGTVKVMVRGTPSMELTLHRHQTGSMALVLSNIVTGMLRLTSITYAYIQRTAIWHVGAVGHSIQQLMSTATHYNQRPQSDILYLVTN